MNRTCKHKFDRSKLDFIPKFCPHCGESLTGAITRSIEAGGNHIKLINESNGTFTVMSSLALEPEEGITVFINRQDALNYMGALKAKWDMRTLTTDTVDIIAS